MGKYQSFENKFQKNFNLSSYRNHREVHDFPSIFFWVFFWVFWELEKIKLDYADFTTREISSAAKFQF